MQINNFVPVIPKDITLDILFILPIKSLLRFMCVSKSWCSLISSKDFIKTRLENSKKDSNSTLPGIISICYNNEKGMNELSANGGVEFVLSPPPVIKLADIPIRVMGSCNGLCCIKSPLTKWLYLWNPATRKCKKLPDIDGNQDDHPYIWNFGFGFDQSNDDYKVVVFFNSLSLYVYSLNTNSWKVIEEFTNEEFKYSYDQCGKFVNGKIHWKWYFDHRLEIVTFDLGSEVRGTIELPSDVKSSGVALEVLGECLCLLHGRNGYIDFWILQVYGVKESWVKLVRFPWDSPVPLPLCIAQDTRILFLDCFNGKVIFYDPRTDSFDFLKISDSCSKYRDVHVILQSLVSPFSDNEL